MHELRPGRLWIGHAFDARDPRRLIELGITAVVDLAYQEPPAVLPRQITYCRVPLCDGEGNEPASLRLAIRIVIELLAAETPTLIACSAGLSRSPSIAAAALAVYLRESPEDTLSRIASRRTLDVGGRLWEDVRRVVAETKWN